MRHPTIRNTIALASLGAIGLGASMIEAGIADQTGASDAPNVRTTQAAPRGDSSSPIPPEAPASPTVIAVGEPAGAGSARMTARQRLRTDDDEVTITIANDDVDVVLNGERVPPDRIRRTDRGIEILDEDGDLVEFVELRFLGTGAASPTPPRVRGLLRRAPGSGVDVLLEEVQRPPVMLGITMEDVDESVLEHLGVEPGNAILVQSIIDGLPAEKAGLKANDIIVEIDGEPASQGRLREVLDSKSAGDELELVLVRKGDRKEIEVRLEAYDASALGVEARERRNRFTLEEDLAREQFEDARRRLAEAQQELKGLRSDRQREQVARALSEAMRALEQNRGAIAREREALERFAWRMGPEDRDDDMMLFTPAPPTGSAQIRDVIEDLEGFEERFEEIEERLDRIDEKLDRLLERNR